MSVDVGAIVFLQSGEKGKFHSPSQVQVPNQFEMESFAAPLPLMEIFGRSVLERMLDRIACCGVREILIVIDEDLSPYIAKLRTSFPGLHFALTKDIWFEVGLTLRRFWDCGIEQAFILDGDWYIEANLTALLEFHRQQSRAVTSACTSEAPLNLWVTDCNVDLRPDELAYKRFFDGSSHFAVRDYTKHLVTAKDFRKLVVDSFLGRCQMHPSGREIRPGVWVEEDTQVSRVARIVAPAYVGHGVTISENALITRCSNVEQGSHIDCATAIEDTTILPHTYVGISLDIRHSLVHGNKLLNLERDVVIQSDDPCLFRSTLPVDTSGIGARPQFDLVRISRAQEASDSEATQGQECCAKSVPSGNPTTEFES